MRIILAVLFLLITFGASAQFTITDTKKTELLPPLSILDTVKVDPNFTVDYYSRAAVRAERLARRKKRNTTVLDLSLGITQTRFDNKSGDNSFSILAGTNFSHTFKADKFSNIVRFKANYGLQYYDTVRFKNVDNFRVEVIPSWEIRKNWAFAMTGVLVSQFDVGYKNKTDTIKRSNFMAPGTLTLSGGVTYNKGPWSITASPIGGTGKFVLDSELSDEGLHGVEKGKRQKWSVSPSVRVYYRNDFVEELWGHTFSPKLLYFESTLNSYTDMKFGSDAVVSWIGDFRIRPIKWLVAKIQWWGDLDKTSNVDNPKAPQWQYIYTISLTYQFKNK